MQWAVDHGCLACESLSNAIRHVITTPWINPNAPRRRNGPFRFGAGAADHIWNGNVAIHGSVCSAHFVLDASGTAGSSIGYAVDSTVKTC